jgi:hypothetical protein
MTDKTTGRQLHTLDSSFELILRVLNLFRNIHV